MTLTPGKFYKSKDGERWLCIRNNRAEGLNAPEQAAYDCIRVRDLRVEYFYADGRYDEGGLREHCLVGEL